MGGSLGASPVKLLLIVLALLVAPVLVSMDMGKAQAAAFQTAASAGACDDPCMSHHRPAAVPHGGLACTVSCATAAFPGDGAVMAPPVAVAALRLTPPLQHSPAKTSWPPPLPPPRS